MSTEPGTPFAGFLIFRGIGAALGLGLDALNNGNKVVYRRAPTIQPVADLRRGHANVGLAVSW